MSHDFQTPLTIYFRPTPARAKFRNSFVKEEKVCEMLILNYSIECQGKTEACEETIRVNPMTSDLRMKRKAERSGTAVASNYDFTFVDWRERGSRVIAIPRLPKNLPTYSRGCTRTR